MQLHLNDKQQQCVDRFINAYNKIRNGNIDELIDLININGLDIDRGCTTEYLYNVFYNDYKGNTEPFVYNSVMTVDEAFKFYNVIEIIARIQMGQYTEIFSLLEIDKYLNERFEIETELKGYFLPELNGAYYGIGSPHLPECSAIIWDIRDHVRFVANWLQYPYGGWTVNFDYPVVDWSKEPVVLIQDNKQDELFLNFVKRFRSSIIMKFGRANGDLTELYKLIELEEQYRSQDKLLPAEYYNLVFN